MICFLSESLWNCQTENNLLQIWKFIKMYLKLSVLLVLIALSNVSDSFNLDQINENVNLK